MTKNNELFTTMPVGKAVAKLAIPTVVSQIIVILYSLADTFFIGQIGDPNQIAALSITFPIYTLLTAVANLFGIGANSVIARSLGQNDESTAKKASAFAFWASLGVTLVLSVGLALFMQPILLFFGADEFTLGFTRDYLFWVFVIGGLPTVAGLVLGHLVRSVGKTKEAGLGLTIGGVMNIILDPVFIFVFHMDVAGAAVATMLSNAISMVYFFVVLYRIRKETVLTISPKHFSLERKVSWGTLSVGFPAAISVLLVSVSIALLNGLLLKHEGGQHPLCRLRCDLQVRHHCVAHQHWYRSGRDAPDWLQLRRQKPQAGPSGLPPVLFHPSGVLRGVFGCGPVLPRTHCAPVH